ncbi:MAG: oligosaccharide flippase family protein [Deltaproteobacteria bacterium]|nr:oligosaccharide flippase family protein [Deltaproteobacteria bacterium]
MLISKNNFNRIFAWVKASEFVKNIAVVMTGTAIAQLLGFLLSPIISRLYSPYDFGVYGSFDAILSVIAAGVTLDYSQAIMLPKDKVNALNLFVLSCLSTFIISCLALSLCLTIPSLIFGLINSKDIWILMMLVVGILVAGLNQSFQAWCIRVKEFKHTSGSQIVRSISSNGTQVLLGYCNGGGRSLIFATILGNVLASINLTKVLISDLFVSKDQIKWKRIKKLAFDYRDFPMYSASQNVLNSLSRGLGVLLLGHFFGVAVAGAYVFAVRIISVPRRFVLMALRQVLFQRVCETKNLGAPLLPLYLKSTFGLFALTFFPVLVIVIWSVPIVTWIFGAQWYLAGEFTRFLVLWLMVGFCNVPAELFAKAIRIQRFVFFYDLTLLLARATALLLGGLYFSALDTVILFATVGAFMNVILILRVGYAAKKYDERRE